MFGPFCAEVVLACLQRLHGLSTLLLRRLQKNTGKATKSARSQYCGAAQNRTGRLRRWEWGSRRRGAVKAQNYKHTNKIYLVLDSSRSRVEFINFALWSLPIVEASH